LWARHCTTLLPACVFPPDCRLVFFEPHVAMPGNMSPNPRPPLRTGDLVTWVFSRRAAPPVRRPLAKLFPKPSTFLRSFPESPSNPSPRVRCLSPVVAPAPASPPGGPPGFICKRYYSRTSFYNSPPKSVFSGRLPFFYISGFRIKVSRLLKLPTQFRSHDNSASPTFPPRDGLLPPVPEQPLVNPGPQFQHHPTQCFQVQPPGSRRKETSTAPTFGYRLSYAMTL